MSRRLLALYCALLLLLPACKQGGEAGQSGNGGYQVYFAVPFGGEGDPGESAVLFREVDPAHALLHSGLGQKVHALRERGSQIV